MPRDQSEGVGLAGNLAYAVRIAIEQLAGVGVNFEYANEEALLQDIEEKQACPSCHHAVMPEYQLCPHCHTRLKKECQNCHKLLHLKWNICPYCGHVPTDVALTTSPPPVMLPAERVVMGQ